MDIQKEEQDAINDLPLFNNAKEETEHPKDDIEVEEKVAPSPKEAVKEDTDEEPARIPYSRFQTVNEQKIRLEEKLKLLEEQSANKQVEETEDVETPKEWLDLYGDNDQARSAWKLQTSLLSSWQEEAANKAFEKIETTKKEQEEIAKKNLEAIDNILNEFQTTLGRKLSEEEESSLLDIQDEFTPKDEKGNYLAPLIAPEKAFEILTLRTNGSKVAKGQARKRVASITSVGSEGDNSSDDSFTPGDWGAWRE